VKTEKINTNKEYEEVMKRIEKLLQKSTQNGGFDSLASDEVQNLQKLSLMAEKYEDSFSMLPIKTPTTLVK